MIDGGAGGNSELVDLVVSWGASMAVLTALYAIDDRFFMKEDQRALAWPASTRWIAIVVFGVIAVPIHFVKTRGWTRGLAIGAAATLGAGVAIAYVSATVATALGFD